MEHDIDGHPFVQNEPFGSSTCQYSCDYSDPIAKGAFGIVYQAVIMDRGDFTGAEHVAVKVIHLNRQPESVTERRKWAESRQRLQTLRTFSHDNLVRYHKFTIVKGRMGGISIELMMDYHTGGDLSKLIRNLRQQRTLMSAANAVSYTIQITEGLQFLHDRQFIHGDLKPSNILTTQSQNGTRKLAICDLDDIVQMERDSTCSNDITHLRGTVRYMSPEMLKKFVALQDAETPGRKTDMWSLGCIMLELTDCVVGTDQKWLRTENDKIEAGNKITDERFVHLIINGCVPCTVEAIPSCLTAALQQCLHTASAERISAGLLVQQLKALESVRQLKAKEFVVIFRFKHRCDGTNECYVFDPSTQTVTELSLPEDLRCTSNGAKILGISNGRVLYQRKRAGAKQSYGYRTEVMVWDVQKQGYPTILFHQKNTFISRSPYPITVMDKIYFWSNDEFRTLDLRDGTNKILKLPPDFRSISSPYHTMPYHTRARDGNRIIFATNTWDNNSQRTTWVKCFDTVTREWESLPDLPAARNNFAMVVLQKTVYVLGGIEQITYRRSRSCLRLDLQSPTRQWETMRDHLHGRANHCAFVSDDMIYAVGGLGENVAASQIMEVYDTKRDLWFAVSVKGSSTLTDDEVAIYEAANIILGWPVSSPPQ